MKAYIKGILAGLTLSVCSLSSAEDSLRLEWFLQGQFAGPIVAHEKGYYEEEGLDFTLRAAGPDIKPAVMVATGADSFGLGHPNQIVSGRANGAPLVMIAQFGQTSASTYIARKDSGIKSIEDMSGRSVGLWFGGDEQEFMAMLKRAGVNQSDVKIISQGYDIISWLNKDYDVMQVTRYNELLQVYRQGYEEEDLVFIEPKAEDTMASNGLFTTEKLIKEHPERVQAVVNATLRGWKDAIANPEEAAEIVVKHNPELNKQEQIEQIEAMGSMFCVGPTLQGEFGKSRLQSYEVAQRILFNGGLIDKEIDLDTAFTNQFWESAPSEYKSIACKD